MAEEIKKEQFHKKMAIHLVEEVTPVAKIDENIGNVLETLFAKTKKTDSIDYIYVINKNQRLRGVISVKDVFRNPKSKKVKDIMARELITARPHTSRERVAFLAIHHDLKMIPVVDADEKLLGVISANTILDILHQENIEDDLLRAGVTRLDDPAKDIIGSPPLTQIKKRLPWLVVGLFGGLLAAFIVNFFEEALSVYLILAAFIPLVVYMADAVGNQTQTLFIRSTTIDHDLNLLKYIRREFLVGLALSLTLGFTIASFAGLWSGSFAVGLVLGLSISSTILIAMVVAIFLPWFFTKKGIDPAIASGPFATVIRDVTSLLVYFSIAQLFLVYLG